MNHEREYLLDGAVHAMRVAVLAAAGGSPHRRMSLRRAFRAPADVAWRWAPGQSGKWVSAGPDQIFQKLAHRLFVAKTEMMLDLWNVSLS